MIKTLITQLLSPSSNRFHHRKSPIATAITRSNFSIPGINYSYSAEDIQGGPKK